MICCPKCTKTLGLFRQSGADLVFTCGPCGHVWKIQNVPELIDDIMPVKLAGCAMPVEWPLYLRQDPDGAAVKLMDQTCDADGDKLPEDVRRYERAAGAWDIQVKWWPDGGYVAAFEDVDEYIGLVPCTEAEWRESNAGYVPTTSGPAQDTADTDEPPF